MSGLLLLSPELLLLLTLAGVIASEIGYHGEKIRLVTWTAIFGLGAALIQVILTHQANVSQVFEGALSIDGLSVFFRMFFIVLAGLVIIFSSFSKEISSDKRSEFYAFLIASALAMCIASSAVDILVIFLAMQCINVLSFFLAGYSKHSLKSTEAAIKYLLFSLISAAFFLYAVAILFSYAETLSLFEIYEALIKNPLPDSTALVVFVLFFLSFSFYFGAFPMYLWVPDVLEGSPAPSSTFLALGVSAAGFAIALRFFITIFSPGELKVFEGLEWQTIVASTSALTMIVGSLLSIRQKGAKRLIATLVVAQLGFFLTGLLVLTERGVSSLLYNLVISLFALTGTSCVFSFLSDRLKSDRLEEFQGLSLRLVPECICLLIFFASFIGIPPFPGFLGKFLLIGAIVDDGWYILAGISILATVFASVTFARLSFDLIGNMKGKDDRRDLIPIQGQRVFLFFLLTPIVFLAIFADAVLRWVRVSMSGVLW